MNRLLRVVLPGWWGWLLALLVLRGFGLGMDWMTVRWEGHTEHVGRVGYFLTAFAAGVYGIYRLAARVCELKKAGYVIESEVRRDKNKKPYARYFMPAFHRAAA